MIPERSVSVTTLGTGTLQTPQFEGINSRATAANYLQCGERGGFIDTGDGAGLNFTRSGLIIPSEGFVVLTHTDLDHIAGLVFVLRMFASAAQFRGQGSLVVLGPPLINKMINDLYPDTNRGRPLQADTFSVITHVLEPDTEYSVHNALRITAHPAEHNGLTDTHALALTMRDGKKVAFSGDTSPCAGVRAAADNANLFVCNIGGESPRGSKPGHLTVADAIDVALESNVANLVLTHYSGETPNTQLRELAESIAQHQGFTGAVNVATDGDRFNLAA